MRVLIKAPFSPYSGYGNDGIGMARALTRWGCDVYLQPTHVDPPLPPEVAMLLTKHLQAPFDLVLNHVDPANLEATSGMRSSTDLLVGWTMWEYTNFDNLKGTRSTLRKRLSKFDALVAYDEVTKRALQDYTKVPLGVAQGGYEARDWPELKRDWTSFPFRFAMVGALHDRKDPFVAIQAFKELKDEHGDAFNAELHLKTQTPGLHPKMEEWCPGLKIWLEVWPREVLQQFYADTHVLLCPSRGEGKNMPALEFLSSGGTVIATAWGGHCQWLSSDYAYPLRYDLRPMDTKYPNCLNAKADQQHLKDLMWHVYQNRFEARSKGETAARTIPTMCSWEAAVERLFHQVAGLVPGAGERVRSMAMAVKRPEPREVRTA